MTHAEALRQAINAGYVYGDSMYGYRPRKLKNMLRDAQEDPGSAHIEWFFREKGNGKGEIYNSAESEYHLCWK